MRRVPPRSAGKRADRGAAVSEFALVAGLLSLLFMAALQLGLALHVRNTLIADASEGARRGARADSSPADGVARTQELIRSGLSDSYADHVSAQRRVVDGMPVVEVEVRAPLPLIGTFGPGGALTVHGRALAEQP